MAPITTSTEIDSPAEDVFSYAADPANFSKWEKAVVDGPMDQAGNPHVGAQWLTTRRIGGANRPSNSRLKYINQPKTWGVKGIDGPIRATVDLTVVPLTETRSRLTIAVDFEAAASARSSSHSWSAVRPRRKCRPTSRC